jgi:hypothetical protein
LPHVPKQRSLSSFRMSLSSFMMISFDVCMEKDDHIVRCSDLGSGGEARGGRLL